MKGTYGAAIHPSAPDHAQAYPTAGRQQLATIMERFRSPTLLEEFLLEEMQVFRQVWDERVRTSQAESTAQTSDSTWLAYWGLVSGLVRTMVGAPMFHVVVQLQRMGIGQPFVRPLHAELPGENEDGLNEMIEECVSDVSSFIFGSILASDTASLRAGEMTAFVSVAMESTLVALHHSSPSAVSTTVNHPYSHPGNRHVLFTEAQEDGPVPLQLHFRRDLVNVAASELQELAANLSECMHVYGKYGDIRKDAAAPVAIQVPHNLGLKLSSPEEARFGAGLAGLIASYNTGGRDLSPVLSMYEPISKRPYSKQSIWHDGQAEFIRKLCQTSAEPVAASEKGTLLNSLLRDGTSSLQGQLDSTFGAAERPYPLRVELVMPSHVETGSATGSGTSVGVHVDASVGVKAAVMETVREGIRRLLRLEFDRLCGITQSDAYFYLVTQYSRAIMAAIKYQADEELSQAGMIRMDTLSNWFGLLGSIAGVLDNPNDTFLPFQQVMSRSKWWARVASESGFPRPHPFMLLGGQYMSMAYDQLKNQSIDVWGWDMPPVLRVIFRGFSDSCRLHGLRGSDLEETTATLLRATVPFIRPAHHVLVMLFLLGSLNVLALANVDVGKEVVLTAFRQRYAGGAGVLAKLLVSKLVIHTNAPDSANTSIDFGFPHTNAAAEEDLMMAMDPSVTGTLRRIARHPEWFSPPLFRDGRTSANASLSYEDYAEDLIQDILSRQAMVEEQRTSGRRVLDTSPGRIFIK